ncbi:MAG: EAL domain-containing protein [Gallionella sp.]|nr:EAL domain-containing protein [Gallionella sp.]
MNIDNMVNRHPTLVAVTLFLNFVILISAASYALIDNFKHIEKTRAFENLHGIGKLKAGQIQKYLQERKGDAIVGSKFLGNLPTQHWLNNPAGEIPPVARQPLEAAIKAYQYGGALLLDDKANIRFASGQYTGLSKTAKSLALRAINENSLHVSPIYFGDPSAPDKPLLDIFVPLLKPDTPAVMGVLVLRDDLRFLYALLQTWPVESVSGETLLVTRDGDDVLFLNELRFKKDTALKLRLPFRRSADAPPIPTIEMLKHGYYGPIEAVDYREKPTLGFNIAVPDSPWGMTVKMDKDEVLEHVYRLQVIVWIVAALFMLGAGIILWTWWNKQRIEYLAKAELDKAAADLRISAIAFETHEAIIITDCHPKILRVNKAFCDITGYTAEEVIGRNPNMLRGDKRPKAFYDEMWAAIFRDGTWSGEMADKRKNGEVFPAWLTITAVTSTEGVLTHYVGSFFDITERKKSDDEIHRLAFYDSLTDLPNRRLLIDRLQHALTTSERSGRHGAIMFIDLDNFKVINDTKGHDCGDVLLVEVARRLQSCVREGDTVARLGGDEFVVMLEDIKGDMEQAVTLTDEVGEKILASLNQSYVIDGNEYHSTASIGVNLFINREISADTLLKYADIAMYQAKGAGRNTLRFFDPKMQSVLEARIAIESDLHRALAELQFRLYYQAQVDDTGCITGAEALVRWIHPQRGMISPAQFIPIAEESQLILDIGLWVLETACRQLALWSNDEQKCGLVLAVNVSAQQFKLKDFVGRITSIINEHGIDPAHLKLELTESVVLDDMADIVAKMHALKTLGVGLSLDDFGTGYSSLSYLKQLPLNQLKIDRSFVNDIATDPSDAIMVQTIIDMAHNFRFNVIAEGVETEAQLAFLKLHGCKAYQGYLFSKPVPIKEFEALLGKSCWSKSDFIGDRL